MKAIIGLLASIAVLVVLAIGCITAGVWLLFGPGWALVALGVCAALVALILARGASLPQPMQGAPSNG